MPTIRDLFTDLELERLAKTAGELIMGHDPEGDLSQIQRDTARRAYELLVDTETPANPVNAPGEEPTTTSVTDPLAEGCPDSVCQAAPGQSCHFDCSSNWDPWEQTNTDRAEHAEPPLQAFADACYNRPDARDLTDPDAAAQAAHDLIGDLCHFLDRLGITPGAILHNGYSVYLQEADEGIPGDRQTTAYARPCRSGCSASGQPCTWACPSWARPGATRARAETTPTEPPPTAQPAPGYAVVPAPTLNRTTIELPAAPDADIPAPNNETEPDDGVLVDLTGIVEGQGATETCGCGDWVTEYEGEWLHVLNPALTGTDDHDATPGL